MQAIAQPLQPNRASPQATGLAAWYPALGHVGPRHWRDAAGISHLALAEPVALLPDPLRHQAARLGPGGGQTRIDLPTLLPANALSVCTWVGIPGVLTAPTSPGAPTQHTIAAVLTPPSFNLSIEQDAQLAWSVHVGGSWSTCRTKLARPLQGLHHVAGTWDGRTQRLFVDGVERCRATPAGILEAGSGLLQVGSGRPLLLGELSIHGRALHPATIWQMAHPPTWWDLYTESTLSRVALMSPPDPTYFTFLPVVEAGS